jgi:hypothetical protein
MPLACASDICSLAVQGLELLLLILDALEFDAAVPLHRLADVGAGHRQLLASYNELPFQVLAGGLDLGLELTILLGKLLRKLRGDSPQLLDGRRGLELAEASCTRPGGVRSPA